MRSEDKFKAILPYMIKREMKIRFGKRSIETMHELRIVFHIIDSIEEVGRQNKLRRVSTVTLELGGGLRRGAYLSEDCWHWAAARSQLLNGSRLAIRCFARRYPCARTAAAPTPRAIRN